MGVVKIILGDVTKLLDSGAVELIAHGCNCQNIMGAGIAKTLKEKYPAVFEADTEHHRLFNKEYMLGTPSIARVSPKGAEHGKRKLVANLYTQFNLGADAQYQHVMTAFTALNRYCKERTIERIAIPLIGAGIGGLDAAAVVSLATACFKDTDVIVCAFSEEDYKYVTSKYNNFSFPRKFDGTVSRSRILNSKPRGQYNVMFSPSGLVVATFDDKTDHRVFKVVDQLIQ